MPQDTRPRTVTPQNQPIAAPDSGLADILARAGVVPFNPNTGGSPDLQSVIQSLLTPQPTPQPQQQGLLQSILGALQAGAAAATGSPILAQQVQQQKAQQFAQQQQEREQSDRMNQIRQQFGLKLIDSQLGEQQDIAKEQRTYAQRKEERIAEEAARVRQFNMEFAGKEKMDNINFEQQKAITNLTLDYQKQRDLQTDSRFTKKEAQDLIEKKLDVKLGLIRSGLPAGVSTSIANKWFMDEPLSKSEESALTASAQRSLAQAAKAARGGSGGGGLGISSKEAFRLIFESAKTPYVELQDGTIVEATAVPKNVAGIPDERMIKRRLTPAEGAEYAGSKILPSVINVMQGKQPTPTPVPKTRGLSVADGVMYGPHITTNTNAPTAQSKAQDYQRQFDSYVKAGRTPQEVGRVMLDFATKEAPEDKVIIDGIVKKNLKRKK